MTFRSCSWGHFQESVSQSKQYRSCEAWHEEVDAVVKNSVYQERLMRFYFPISSSEGFSWCICHLCSSPIPTRSPLLPEDLEISKIRVKELQQIIFPKEPINCNTSPASGLSCKLMKTAAPQSCAIMVPFSPVLPVLSTNCHTLHQINCVGPEQRRSSPVVSLELFFFILLEHWVLG